MPKAVDRSKHFEHLSNEDLVKYALGTPISIVSGKSIKKGSYEHRYQLASIRKLLMARRLKNQINGTEVCFNDSTPDKTNTHETAERPRKPERKQELQRVPSELKSMQIKADLPVQGNGIYPVLPVLSSTPSTPFTETSFGFSTGIPSHLLDSTLPTKNKNNYF